MALCDELESRIHQFRKDGERLFNSILHQLSAG